MLRFRADIHKSLQISVLGARTALATAVPLLLGLTSGAVEGATTCRTVAACIFGQNTSSGIGVEGTSLSGHGVQGNSTTGFGVVGITSAKPTTASAGKAGVEGIDSTPCCGYGFNSGVYGSSASGNGVWGTSTNGHGVTGTTGGQGIGVYGSALGTDKGFSGTAVFGYSESDGGGTAVLAETYGFGTLFRGNNSTADVVTIDSSGNEQLAGTLTTQTTPYIVTRRSTGPDVASYGARTSSPTFEDFGKASLRQGAAYVTLEATFASAIDRSNYMVFLTPEGDSHGLYAVPTSNGFMVHENGGGHSSLAFSYRIVARPTDTRSLRLPPMSTFKQLRHGAAIVKGAVIL